MTCRPNTKSFEKPSTLFDRPTHEQVFEARYRSKNHKFQQPVRLITPWRIAAVIAVKYYDSLRRRSESFSRLTVGVKSGAHQ